MTIPGLIFTIIAGALLVWGITLFNFLVRDKNRVAAAWSDIEVQLKRRHDLLAKLIEAVKQYQAYEKAVMENVTALRSRAETTGDLSEKGEIENVISRNIRQLILVAENYPELKSSQNFLDLQQNISDAESQIQYARRYYNGAVRNLNTRIDSFPDMLIARLFRFQYRQYFNMDGEE